MPPLLAAIPPFLSSIGLSSAATATATALAGSGLIPATGVTALSAGAPIGIGSMLGSGLALAGTGLSMIGQIQQGRAQSEIAQANARAAELQAKSIQEAGKAESYKLSKQRRRMIGTQANLLASAGVDIGSGSPLDVMLDTAKSYEEDLQTLGYNTDLRRAAPLYQASIYDWTAKNKRRAGWMGAMGTMLDYGLSSLESEY